MQVFHTTNLPHRNSEMQVEKKHFDKIKIRYAKAGDILLSRVGCIGNISMVKSGKIPITDCIYRIRVPAKYRKIV
jgi:type I restriction enzyme M protein